jgi:energy-coupling factor transporter ATP-binding protein EcfA2
VNANIFPQPFLVNRFLPAFDFDTLPATLYIALLINSREPAIDIMSSSEKHKDSPSSMFDGFQPEAVKAPGLTKAFHEIPSLARNLRKRLDILKYKQRMSCLWVVFVGGTGTGKSTLFNALCGAPLSETGVERPKTYGPILYAPKGCPVEKNFPLPGAELCKETCDAGGRKAATGAAGRLVILEHGRAEFSHLLLADTPDLDSIELDNRQIAEDLFLLSDAVIFVTSQEKYADEVPHRFLLRILQGKKPFFVLFNKAEKSAAPEDFLSTIKGEALSPAKDRLWIIPYAPAHPLETISQHPSFLRFKSRLEQELAISHVENLRAHLLSERARDLRAMASRLLSLLHEEQREAEAWRSGLRERCDKLCKRFIKEQEESFSQRSREFIQREIRKLFSKYDVLAKPRRAVKEILLTPLRVIGLLREQDHQEALLRVRQRIDLLPVQTAVESFNGVVLKELSPRDPRAPLFDSMRQPGVALTAEEVRMLMFQEQERLEHWLENQFNALSLGIPWTKKWGIYSTSILWGILIIAFEIVVGGGFSILDAALDSAIAPFVTKGAVELFAYHEIQKVARELAQRYQDGLLSVMKEQEKRYEACLDSLLTAKKVVREGKELLNEY